MGNQAMATIGFIGLGVMGGPMSRNIAVKHHADVMAFDLNAAAFEALADTKAQRVHTIAELAERCDIVCLSLPGGKQVEEVCLGAGGLSSVSKPPKIVIDLSTTSVASARKVAQALADKNIAFVDAPVARTREAAQKGELSIMVGASAALFAEVEPVLRYMGTDVTLCGEVGCGQVVKLINNTLLFENTVAIAEMMVVGERAGVAPATLIDAVSKGSGDSFALRNHARKSMQPRQYPEKSFPPEYVLKDISYTLELAQQTGVSAHAAELAKRYYAATAENGYSGRYFPAVIEMVDRNIKLPD
jgi:3-hydroxyisobutyrate dehydrogenase-like beta-hydroxyacid dehydrogenase